MQRYGDCWALIGTTHNDHLMVSIVVPNLVKIDAVVSITRNFQYFARLAWKRVFTPKNSGFGGYFTPKMGSNINETPKGTSAGRNDSSGVLIMSVSSVVPKKSRGNKKCDEEELEEEKRHIFWPFGITVKWPWHGCMQLFWYLYVHTVEDSTLMSIID